MREQFDEQIALPMREEFSMLRTVYSEAYVLQNLMKLRHCVLFYMHPIIPYLMHICFIKILYDFSESRV